MKVSTSGLTSAEEAFLEEAVKQASKSPLTDRGHEVASNFVTQALRWPPAQSAKVPDILRNLEHKWFVRVDRHERVINGIVFYVSHELVEAETATPTS